MSEVLVVGYLYLYLNWPNSIPLDHHTTFNFVCIMLWWSVIVVANDSKSNVVKNWQWNIFADRWLEVFLAINGTYISMVFRFRAKSQNNEKSNTELELFELIADLKFVPMVGQKSSWNSLLTNTDKLTSVIFVHKALHWALYHDSRIFELCFWRYIGLVISDWLIYKMLSWSNHGIQISIPNTCMCVHVLSAEIPSI